MSEPWPYKGMDEADLAHIENCLRYTVEDDDLAVDVVLELAAAGYMIVPVPAGIADTARKKTRMSEPTPSELRSIADWLDVYEDAIEQLILGLHSGPVPLDSALFDIHVCPGNEMQDDLRWWADDLVRAGIADTETPR